MIGSIARVLGVALLMLFFYGFWAAGKRAADRWYQAEPDVMRCPVGHVCRWIEVDATSGKCLQNCGEDARR